MVCHLYMAPDSSQKHLHGSGLLQARIPRPYFFGTGRRGRMNQTRQVPKLRMGFPLAAQLRTAHQRRHPAGDHGIRDADFQSDRALPDRYAHNIPRILRGPE